MPGRLPTNFRSGNLAEHLGVLLLKGIATVTEVPRTEDVGVDAIANLLRRDEDGNSYAEDSFIVQLKAQSTASIKYRDHELSWLLDQTHPMFIGRVSLKKSSISLYPTLYANQAVLAWHAKEITVRFGTSEHSRPWRGDSGLDSATVWLGEPLLTWTLSDLGKATWLASAYEILKRFLGIARREYELLSFGQCSKLAWRTNDKDSIQSSFMMMKGLPDELQSLAERCKPCLKALLLNAPWRPEESGNSLIKPLTSLVSSFRDLGVDLDPSNLLSIVALQTSSASDSDEENSEGH